MGFEDWIAEPLNWVFAAVALATVVSGLRVVTSPNVVHAALFLVAALAGTAAVFLLLAAEFLAWVLVLVYIGAVIVLFLFGIMITRAPTGRGRIQPRSSTPLARPPGLGGAVRPADVGPDQPVGRHRHRSDHRRNPPPRCSARVCWGASSSPSRWWGSCCWPPWWAGSPSPAAT